MTNLIWSTIYTHDGELFESSLTLDTFEKFTKASRKKIFDVFTNYGAYQKWIPQHFPSVRIISVRPHATLAEEHRIIAGAEFVVMAKHIVKDSLIHETFFVGGDAKGSHITEKFDQISTGTLITVTIDFKPKLSMKLSGLVGKPKYLKDFENIVDEFIKIAEI